MASAARTGAIERPAAIGDEIEREIARLVAPGLRANAWRRDFDRLRQRRLWDENHQAHRIRTLRQTIPGLAKRAILDLGCGRGGLAVALRRQGYPVVALDLRRHCCRVTRLRGRRYALDVPAVGARGEHLPFRDQSFGTIVCRDVLEHSDRPDELLGEIWRVLRRGGSCYLTVINRLCWVDPHYHLLGVSFIPRTLAERYVRLRGRAKEPSRDRQRLSNMHYYSYRGFVRRARRLGFEVSDLRARELRRHRRQSLGAGLRWLGDVLLRPVSLQSNHFEFLLHKNREGGGEECR